MFSAKLVHLPMAQDNATKASNKEQILLTKQLFYYFSWNMILVCS